jgi:hypothetical protein
VNKTNCLVPQASSFFWKYYTYITLLQFLIFGSSIKGLSLHTNHLYQFLATFHLQPLHIHTVASNPALLPALRLRRLRLHLPRLFLRASLRPTHRALIGESSILQLHLPSSSRVGLSFSLRHWRAFLPRRGLACGLAHFFGVRSRVETRFFVIDPDGGTVATA